MAGRVWHVYMLECAGGRLYTGISPDVAARFARHLAGKGAAYTRINKPVRLLASATCGTRGEALRQEHALKQLKRAAKLVWARRFACEMVPGEGLEPPTNGLQNRCTTAVLTRRAPVVYQLTLKIPIKESNIRVL
jgi:putative endonuclease